ncbi:MAG: hypothetical protein RSE39_05685 [Oscillospiraceae bacterium]
MSKQIYKDSFDDGKQELKENLEIMTQLRDNILAPKNCARIKYRGMLDYAQAKTVEVQAMAEQEGLVSVSDDLQSVLSLLRKLMSCDVFDSPLGKFEIFGLEEKEIREISHNPLKYYGIDHLMPDCKYGLLCASVNVLRTVVRQTEIFAIDAYVVDEEIGHKDLICALNRISSAVYIIYCRLISGFYKS